MDVRHRSMEPIERCSNEFCADNRLSSTGDEDFGSEVAKLAVGRELWANKSVLVPTDRVQVGEVWEQRSEEVAHKCHLVIWQPDDAAVDCLAHRSIQLDAKAVYVERKGLVEGDVWHGFRLCHRDTRVLPSDSSGVGAQHVEPDACGSHPQALDPLVVGLACWIVRLGDVSGADLTEQVNPADMVHMRLRGDDVMGGTRSNGIEQPLVVRRFVA